MSNPCVQCGEEYETRACEDTSDMCDHCRCEWCGSADESTKKIRDPHAAYHREMMVCDGCHEKYRKFVARESRGDYMHDMAKDDRLAFRVTIDTTIRFR